jgi:predicted nucleic acid-binding protein
VQFGENAAIGGSASGDQEMVGEQPNWLEFREVTSMPADLRQLDNGEREAIALAQTTGTTLILLDEKKGRQAARECGLSVAGTLGVIDLRRDVDRSACWTH